MRKGGQLRGAGRYNQLPRFSKTRRNSFAFGGFPGAFRGGKPDFAARVGVAENQLLAAVREVLGNCTGEHEEGSSKEYVTGKIFGDLNLEVEGAWPKRDREVLE